MVETAHHQGATTSTAAATATSTSSRLAMRGGTGGGEIVEVQGGHIVRSTGRKDRHSKVCTAKGPRDRRVRLSAHTAIQFYDVQDRLGYDRPSKAVDWLIKKAKAAIDELAELPAFNPTVTCSSAQQQQPQQHTNEMVHRQSPVEEPVIGSSSRTAVGGGRISEQEQFPSQQLSNDNDNNNSGKYKYNSGSDSGGFLPVSLDNDITDTIKSFFPMEAATTSFQSYPPPPDLVSLTASGGGGTRQQDLRLSLQSFQDPIMLHQHHHHHHQAQSHHDQVLFAGTAALGFDGGSGWSGQQQHHHHDQEHEHGRLHRIVACNANAADAGNSGHVGAGFVFSAPSPAPVPAFSHGQYLFQRGPLQSSNTPSVRAWIDPSVTATVADHHHYHYLSPAIHAVSGGGVGFTASGSFSGFRIPARIQGEEEHDGVSDKPSSASSDSRH